MAKLEDLDTVLIIRNSAQRVTEILKTIGSDKRDLFLFGWASADLFRIIEQIEKTIPEEFPEEAKRSGFSEVEKNPFRTKSPSVQDIVLYVEDFQEKIEKFAQEIASSEIEPVGDIFDIALENLD